MKAAEKYLKMCKESALFFKGQKIYNPSFISGFNPISPTKCFLNIPIKGCFEITAKTAKQIIFAFDSEGGLTERYYYNLKKHETQNK
jgi:hypothetical protein